MNEAPPPPESTAHDDPAVGPSRAEIVREASPAGLLAIAWMVVPAILGFMLLVKLGPISEWFAAQGDLGVLIYIGVFAVSAGFGILPTYAQAILGGWVFGIAIGIPAALVGFTGAAAIGYIVARVVSGNRVEKLLSKHRKAEAIRQALIGDNPMRTFGIVTLIRIPPNSPFALTNLLIAACGVRLSLCLIATAVGMLPRTAVAVIFAAMARSTGADDIQAFIKEGLGPWMFIGGVAVMLVVLMIIGSIGKRALERLTNDGDSAV
ncbi:MAG: VTT domain-containing protein [Phycisphaerales bacterium]|nr:VTT domain-containing protein [Phycisphaerales bacterium]